MFDVKFNRFVEPFLGGGAVYFWLNPRNALLSDCNSDLIEAYKTLRDDWQAVHHVLRRHHRNHSPRYYYSIRSASPTSPPAKAARFIYLNRTCWNGLYRVNLKGGFNVPIGTKQAVLRPDDNFPEVSYRLQCAQLITCDFEETLKTVGRGDFVFIDPPYTVKHNRNGFLKYNETIFSWEDQIRLRNAITIAWKRGAKLLITNANHSSIRRLYRGIGERLTVSRASVISGKAASRGPCEEMVIRCV